MVQIQLPEQEKPLEEVEERRRDVESGRGEQQQQQGEAPLLPTSLHLPVPRQRKQTTNKSCIILVLLSCLFAILTVKKICDLNEQNIWLRQQLSIERQKDSALKLAVRDNIPSARFLGHSFTQAEVELVEEEGRLQALPTSTWTINLSVLWASPDITPCDMHKLSHVLADEIYNRVEAREQLAAAWEEKEEEEEEMKENDQAEFLLREWADLKGEEYGSSEESSNEEYDEEAEIPEEEEDEEEYPFPMSDYDYLANVKGEYDELAVDEEEYPFPMSDYDYLANMKGEYDELAVDEETFAEHLYDTDDYYK